MFGEPSFESWQFEFGRRVVKDVIVFREPFEPRPDGNQAAVLTAERERFADPFDCLSNWPAVALGATNYLLF